MMTNVVALVCVFSACVAFVAAVGGGAGALTSKNAVRYGYRPSALNLVMEDRKPQILDALASDLEAMNEERCFGRRCSANAQCCRGSVCVELENMGGSCFPEYGVRQGEACLRDHDCSAGLLCTDSVEGEGIFKTCQSRSAAASGTKQYNDECLSSKECDISKGLCCQSQRRHRGGSRRRCMYFKDAGSCLGSVDILSSP